MLYAAITYIHVYSYVCMHESLRPLKTPPVHYFETYVYKEDGDFNVGM